MPGKREKWTFQNKKKTVKLLHILDFFCIFLLFVVLLVMFPSGLGFEKVLEYNYHPLEGETVAPPGKFSNFGWRRTLAKSSFTVVNIMLHWIGWHAKKSLFLLFQYFSGTFFLYHWIWELKFLKSLVATKTTYQKHLWPPQLCKYSSFHKRT